jgi:hypothetical protein
MFSTGFCQDPVTYSKVIHIEDSTSSISLYNKIKTWIALNYTSAQNVIQMDDENSGILVVKALFDYVSPKYPNYYSGVINYTLKIQVKENRYRVELSDFVHTSDIGGENSFGVITDKNRTSFRFGLKKAELQINEHIRENTKLLSQRLMDSIQNGVKESIGEDDW